MPMTKRCGRMAEALRRVVALVLSVLAIAAAQPAFAHDIPTDVHVQGFVKPEGQHLFVLLRVPLGAMNEVDMPLRGPGYLDLTRADAALRVAAELWFADNLSLFEDGLPLPRATLATARVSLASDRSFASWSEAMAHLREPPILPATDLYWKAQYFDLLLDVPIAFDSARFSIEPRFARMGLQVLTTLIYLPPGGAERAFEFHGNPGVVYLDPRWHQAALRFVEEGFWHILGGTDHLLFIACLVIPFRRLRPLIVIATAFTVAHSMTLAAAVLGLAPQGLWFPPLVELLIAASIVAMALENFFGTTLRRRWIAAFAFGLVHGCGFAFALRETLQFAGPHLATALVSFNVGVELGQIAVLLVLVPALNLLCRVWPERAIVIVLSALVAHTAWHWMTDRWAVLRQFPMPAIDAGALASLLRWLMAAIAAALAVWAADRFVRRWMGAEDAPAGQRPAD